MLDDNFKKSAIEKLKSMDSNELKKAFKEIGSEPETNEEWFSTLTTEGKAEVIAQLSSYGGNVEAILDWLKEKHDGSV